jgi:hypothetical protein
MPERTRTSEARECVALKRSASRPRPQTETAKSARLCAAATMMASRLRITRGYNVSDRTISRPSSCDLEYLASGLLYSLARQCAPVVWLSKTAAQLRGGRGNCSALQEWPRERMAIRKDHLRYREVFHRPRPPRAAGAWVSNSSPAGESRRHGIQTRTPCFPSRRLSTKREPRPERLRVYFFPKMQG